MSTLYSILFSWFPTLEMRLAIAGLFTLFIVFLVMRIVKIVLDSIPFL